MQILDSLLAMLNEMSPYILLGFLIAGVMHAFVSQRTLAHHLSGKNWPSVIKAALFGVPLPLCSCGVLPTAIGMRRNGASRAASASFLIATPQTGVDSIAATWSLLGPAFAIIRPIAALVTAFFGGIMVGRFEQDEEMSTQCPINGSDIIIIERKTIWQRCIDALRYGFIDLVGSIGAWLIIGLVIAALITVYVPADFFAAVGEHPIISMLAVLIIAIPMYVCATGSIPIALSLMIKGLSPGTALVLLMAGPAANFASFTLIAREMGRRSAVIYLIAIIVGAILFGLAIDYLLPASWFDITAIHPAACHHGAAASTNAVTAICSVILVSLLIFTQIKQRIHRKINITPMTKEYLIKGMNCPHCQAAVTKAIQSVDGVSDVSVDLASGKAIVDGKHCSDAVISAVRNAGFDVE